jgi:hypothetical protein
VRKLKIVSEPDEANRLTHENDAERTTPEPHTDRIRFDPDVDRIRFDPDVDRIALEPDASFVLDHGECVMDMSVDGDWMLTAGSDAKICVWKIKLDPEDEEPLKRVLKGSLSAENTSFSPKVQNNSYFI